MFLFPNDMKNINIYCPTDKNWKIQLLNKELNEYGINIVKYSLTDKIVNENYVESAKIKASRSFGEAGKPILAVEVGFSINAFNGWPHTNIAYEIEHLGIHNIADMAINQSDRTFNYGLALAFLDSYSQNPKTFVHGFNGEISGMPAQPDADKEVTKLERIMIPKGYTKEIGSMDEIMRKEFKDTFETAFKEFGEWFKEKHNK
jgi:inosine/xanthosine triphosphate pyrophosphatase family protein